MLLYNSIIIYQIKFHIPKQQHKDNNDSGKKFQYNYLDRQTGSFFAVTSKKYLTFFLKK